MPGQTVVEVFFDDHEATDGVGHLRKNILLSRSLVAFAIGDQCPRKCSRKHFHQVRAYKDPSQIFPLPEEDSVVHKELASNSDAYLAVSVRFWKH